MYKFRCISRQTHEILKVRIFVQFLDQLPVTELFVLLDDPHRQCHTIGNGRRARSICLLDIRLQRFVYVLQLNVRKPWNRRI